MNLRSLSAVREIKKAEDSSESYQIHIQGLDKFELLNEMIRYQEERTAIGQLTPGLMVRGRILFSALEIHAETEALRSLSGSYKRHLGYEIEEFLKSGQVSTSSQSDTFPDEDEAYGDY